MGRGRLWRCLALAALLLWLPTALAATVIAPKRGDIGKRLERAKQSIRDSAVGSYGMVPIYPRDIRDGAYDVTVESSSVFFRIVAARLIVEGEEMTVQVTLGSQSYLYVYLGTASEAEGASRENWIGGEMGEDSTTFTMPVSALNAPFLCAAYSKNRQLWYDRQLLIDAASLPEDALPFELPDYALAERAITAWEPDEGASDGGEAAVPAPEPVALARSDGEYSIEVNLAGGSGRANVSSPTLLVVREGKGYARLLWSSPYYDYMIVGGETYENLTTDGGNSTFEIPIVAMDEPMAVVADTTAMGDPIEINYTLTFYSESIGDRSRIPQEAAMKVLYISLAIIVVGAALNALVKRKRR